MRGDCGGIVMGDDVTRSAGWPEPPLLLTVKQTKAVLGLGHTTIYRLLGRGELQGVRIGAARRITMASVEAFVARLSERGSDAGA
jgi:excisionase family DNA binding protein